MKLEGHVLSTPPAEVFSWWKRIDGNEGEIDINCEKYHGSDTNIKSNPVLTVNKLDFADEGSYWLRVDNAVGRGESTHYLAKCDRG